MAQLGVEEIYNRTRKASEFYLLSKLVYPIFELYFSIIDKSLCLRRAGAFCLAILEVGRALQTVKKGVSGTRNAK